MDSIHKSIQPLLTIQLILLIIVSKYKLNLHFLPVELQIIIKLMNLNAKLKKAWMSLLKI